MDNEELEKFEPDYTERCFRCEQSPCVVGVVGDKEAFRSEMCGPCTFGTADALDPDNW